MAFRPLKSFFATADELLHQDLPRLGGVLLRHLKSYEGLNTVYQHAGLNRGYFRAMLENRNVGLGPLPKEPEYGIRQPEVTKRMMEAWNWLERQGLLIHNDEQVADWFIISSAGEEYMAQKEVPAPAGDPARVSKPGTRAPRALLSYSWEDSEHQQWVSKFAERLQGESGVEIVFDKWHLNPGDDKQHFMEQAVVDSDFVIVVCTPAYATRVNKREGGVGYESMVITAEMAEHILTNKFVPVLRKGTWASSLPIYLKSRMGVDLSDAPYHEDEYEKLLRALHKEPIQSPPLASKPDFSKKSLLQAKPTTAQDATVTLPQRSSHRLVKKDVEE
jgi:TIR domain